MNDTDRRFEELCERYRERLVKDLVRSGCRPQDAEEVAQETLLAAWKHIENIPRDAEWPYLKVAAHNLNRNRVRAENAAMRGGGAKVSLETFGGVMADKSSSVEERLLRDEQAERFRREFAAALSELPEETRLWIVMRRRGMSPQEIAAIEGAGRTAVRSRLSRAFQHLRERVGSPPPGAAWAELTEENDDDHKE
ncbi:MAG TPA: RNA polymerase sigma factor [Thermoanaerobaculia bacterium]|nr:RNA polymerase sigma factor [Thermoanaerobaculia bacterium]